MDKKIKVFLAAFTALAVSVSSTVCYAASKNVSTTLSGNSIRGELSVADTSASASLNSSMQADLSVNGYVIIANRYDSSIPNYQKTLAASEGATFHVSSSVSVNNTAHERIVSGYCTFYAWYNAASWSESASY